MQNFSSPRVLDGKEVRMERLAVEGDERGLCFLSEMAGLGLEVRAVDGIAHQRMADMGEVHPDLMSPSGLEPAGEQRGDRLAVAPLKHLL